MPANSELGHQLRTRGRAAGRTLTATALTIGALSAPSQAGLLSPVLNLMRPQVEAKISEACLRWSAMGNRSLIERLTPACQALAAPTSRCLVAETQSSGRSLGVISELLAGRFGDDLEVVVKRCAGRMLGLSPETFGKLPLRDLAERFNSLKAQARR
nr:hypothetical protein [Vulcanococcus sp. DEBay_Sum22DG08_74]